MPNWAYLGAGARVLDPHLSVFLKPELISIGAHSRLDALIKLEGTVTIGEHVHVASFCHIGVGGGEVIFGAHSGCSSHVVICSGMSDTNYLYICAADLPENQHPLRMKTIIGEHVVIFAGAIVLPGVVIGDGAVIGAGAVVTGDIPKFAVAHGNPARVVRYRNSFELLDANAYLDAMGVAGQWRRG